MHFFTNSSKWTEKDEKVWGKSKQGRLSGQEMILLNGLWNKLRGRLRKDKHTKIIFLCGEDLHCLVHFHPLPFPILWSLCFFSFLLATFFQLAHHKVHFKCSSQWCLGIIVPIWYSYQRGTGNLQGFLHLTCPDVSSSGCCSLRQVKSQTAGNSQRTGSCNS